VRNKQKPWKIPETIPVNKINTKEDERQSRRRNQTEDSFQSRRKRSQSYNRHYGNKQGKSSRKCGNCGGYAPDKNPCPARAKICNACGKIGHFAHVFRSKPRTVASVDTEETSDEEYEYVYTTNPQENRNPSICQLQANGKSVEMVIDSDASVNLLNEITFARIKSHGNESLRPTQTKIYSYGSETRLPLLGTFNATVKSSYASTSAQLLVFKGENENLLSYHTSQKLGLTAVSVNTATIADSDKNSPALSKEEFKSLFGGIGKVQNKKVKPHIDSDMAPKQLPHR